MSVLLETSVGDLVVDLFTDKCPVTTKNFLKLCKLKHYNLSLFAEIQKDFVATIENPICPSTSIYEKLAGPEAKFFHDEIHVELKFNRKGLLGCANSSPNANDSRFFITLADDHLEQLDGKHTLFGVVAEGLDCLDTINELYIDDKGRPYANVRIKHTLVLDDPFDEIEGIEEAENQLDDRLEHEEAEKAKAEELKDESEVIKETKKHENKTRAIVLEMLNDLPDADIKPPDNVLFICKLNPATQERDLEVIFSRFGAIRSLEVIRDWKTGASLQYAFIEFETPAACYEAYLNMENTLIDERRIHVDFSQSVSKLWPKKRKPKVEDGKTAKGDINTVIEDEVVELRGKPTNYHNYKFVVDSKKKPNKLKSISKSKSPLPLPKSKSKSKSKSPIKKRNRRRKSDSSSESRSPIRKSKSHKISKGRRRHNRSRSSS